MKTKYSVLFDTIWFGNIGNIGLNLHNNINQRICLCFFVSLNSLSAQLNALVSVCGCGTVGGPAVDDFVRRKFKGSMPVM